MFLYFIVKNGDIFYAKAYENIEELKKAETLICANTPLFLLVFQGHKRPKPSQTAA